MRPGRHLNLGFVEKCSIFDDLIEECTMKMKLFRRFIIVAMAACALLACNKDETGRPMVSIMSGETFDENNTAEVTVVVSSAAKKDLTVFLAVSALSQPGMTAIPGSHLQFPASVTIATGATSVSFTATLVNSEGLSADTYSAGIQLTGGSGYYISTESSITYIKYSGGTYSGDGGGGNGEGGEGGGSNVQLSLQSNWTVSITGTELEYDDEDNAYIEGVATAPGSTYLYFDTYTDAELAEYAKGDIATIIPELESSIAEQLAKGSTMDDLLYEAGAVYIPYYDAGETYVYMLDFDANGKATGKYGKVRVDMPEVEEEGGFEDFPDDITSASLQTNWTLTFTETYNDEEDGWLDVLKVTTPGATYIDLTWLDDEDLAEYENDLDVLNTAQFYNYYMYYEDYASTPTQIFYVDKEDAYYEHEAGTWTVFLIDFNADWTLTGKYGKCTVTIPTHPQADATGTSSVAGKPLWKKYNRHFIPSRAIRKNAPKPLLNNIKR